VIIMSSSRLPKFERDSAYKKRGGTAEWLLLKCGVCRTEQMFYQKDGQGSLFRLYLDRITSSDGLRPFSRTNIDNIRALNCFSCEAIIGAPMIYQKDEHPRVAIRLVDSGVIKQVIHNSQEWESIGPLDVRVTLSSMILPEQPKKKEAL